MNTNENNKDDKNTENIITITNKKDQMANNVESNRELQMIEDHCNALKDAFLINRKQLTDITGTVKACMQEDHAMLRPFTKEMNEYFHRLFALYEGLFVNDQKKNDFRESVNTHISNLLSYMQMMEENTSNARTTFDFITDIEYATHYYLIVWTFFYMVIRAYSNQEMTGMKECLAVNDMFMGVVNSLLHDCFARRDAVMRLMDVFDEARLFLDVLMDACIYLDEHYGLFKRLFFEMADKNMPMIV